MYVMQSGGAKCLLCFSITKSHAHNSVMLKQIVHYFSMLHPKSLYFLYSQMYSLSFVFIFLIRSRGILWRGNISSHLSIRQSGFHNRSFPRSFVCWSMHQWRHWKYRLLHLSFQCHEQGMHGEAWVRGRSSRSDQQHRHLWVYVLFTRPWGVFRCWLHLFRR